MKNQANVIICPPCGEQSLAPEGFNPGVAVATKEGQNRKNALWPLLPRLTAVLPPQGREMSKGFTLIELLVVVLIIGILAAVALPQYQKAVLKSRYSALMPIAKALAEGNELYYMEHGNYSQNPVELSIQGNANNEVYADGTSVLMDNGAEDGLSFVLASNNSVPNARYVVYQKHSANFADTTMCEAADDRANALCQALGGTLIEKGGNSTGDTEKEWTVYLLSGTYGDGDHFAQNGENNENNEEEQQMPPCELPTDEELATLQENIRAGSEYNANVTVSAECVNGKVKYVWSGGKRYPSHCNTSVPYGCFGSFIDGPCNSYASHGCVATYQANTSCAAYKASGCTLSDFVGDNTACSGEVSNGCTENEFSGKQSRCRAKAIDGCSNSEFSGKDSNCLAWERSSGMSCTNNTFSGENSVCKGKGSGSCANNTFSGQGAHCESSDVYDNVCSGSTFLPGAYCQASSYGKGCENTEYPIVEVDNGDGTTTQTRGCCYSTESCPSGTPKCDPTTKTWDGTYW